MSYYYQDIPLFFKFKTETLVLTTKSQKLYKIGLSTLNSNVFSVLTYILIQYFINLDRIEIICKCDFTMNNEEIQIPHVQLFVKVN